MKRKIEAELTLAQLAGDLFGADTSPLPAGMKNVSGNVKALLRQNFRETQRR